MRTIPILMYHSVADEVDERYRTWSVTPRRFASHMAAVAEHGYKVIGVSEAFERLDEGFSLPDKTAILTFDDGLQDFLLDAYPILEKHGFRATLYVVAGLISGKSRWLSPLGEGERPMLSAREIHQLHANGIEIGAHSVSHRQLDLLDRGSCEKEIIGSRNILQDVLGDRITSFAYPHGYTSSVTKTLVRNAGFTSAVRVRHALSHTTEDRFGLSRLIIRHNHDRNDLIALLQGEGVPTAPPQDRIAGTCWRFMRRIRNRITPPSVYGKSHLHAGGTA